MSSASTPPNIPWTTHPVVSHWLKSYTGPTARTQPAFRTLANGSPGGFGATNTGPPSWSARNAVAAHVQQGPLPLVDDNYPRPQASPPSRNELVPDDPLLQKMYDSLTTSDQVRFTLHVNKVVPKKNQYSLEKKNSMVDHAAKSFLLDRYHANYSSLDGTGSSGMIATTGVQPPRRASTPGAPTQNAFTGDQGRPGPKRHSQ